MIIASDNKLEINQVVRSGNGKWMSDNESNIHHDGWSFRVLRKATFDEYAKYSIEHSSIPLELHDIDEITYYYEVIMD